MKKIRLFISVIGLLLSLGLSVSASALESQVKFVGGAEKFVFLPGTDWSETDLFDGFKNAMPGDNLTEEIIVKNETNEYDYVKIYMRFLEHDESSNPLSTDVAESETIASMSEFLEQLTMQIYKGDELIYQSSPDKPDGLSEYVPLGQFAQGDNVKLRIELGVPIELDNRFSHRSGEVDLVFMAEGYGDSPRSADTGQNTRDTSGVVAVVSGVAIVLIVVALGYGARLVFVRARR